MRIRDIGVRLLGVALIALAAGLVLPATARAGDEEMACLALTIYHEARGESARGQVAVGHVVMNRTRSTLFPAGVCDVVREGEQHLYRCQFSWWCDGRSDWPRDQDALRESLLLAEQIHDGCGSDPTGGALWYHATTVRPSWAKSFGPGKRIGQHIFYRGNQSAPMRVYVVVKSPDVCDGEPRWRTQLNGS